MLFRRLNWNIVGWFRIVSTISYLIIALGFGAMIYHGFQGGKGFQPSHMLRLGLSFTGGTDIAVQFTQPTTADKVKSALGSLGLTDESVTTAGTSGKAFVIQTQIGVRQRLGTAVERAQYRRAGRSRRSRRSPPSDRRSAASISPTRSGRWSSRWASSSCTSRSASAGTTFSVWSPSSRSCAMRR